MLKAGGFSLLSSTVFVKQIKPSSSQGVFFFFSANLLYKRDGKKRFFFIQFISFHHLNGLG
jgi:hypothetical protein